MEILQIFVRPEYLCGFYGSRVEGNISNNCEGEIFVWLRLREILQIFVGRNCFEEFVREENRGKYLVKES